MFHLFSLGVYFLLSAFAGLVQNPPCLDFYSFRNAVLNNFPYHTFGVIVFHGKLFNVCAVILSDDVLLYARWVEQTLWKRDLLPFEHTVYFNSHIRSQPVCYVSVYRIEQLRVLLHEHMHHLIVKVYYILLVMCNVVFIEIFIGICHILSPQKEIPLWLSVVTDYHRGLVHFIIFIYEVIFYGYFKQTYHQLCETICSSMHPRLLAL